MAKTGRRYRVGESEIYDRNYEMRKAGSPIFHPQRATTENAWAAAMLGDKAGLERLLEIWRGNKDGVYFDRGRERESVLSAAKKLLSDVEAQFETEKQSAINQGKRPPEVMHPALDKRRLIAEANLDMVQGEVERLETLLASATAKKEEADDSQVLKHGPRGHGKMRDGVIAFMDGQKVSRNESGMFAIDDARSPYNKMLVHDYLEMIVRPWYFSNAKLRAELREKVDRGELAGNAIPLGATAPWPEPPGK
jgi:hypothetical protein